MHMNLINGTSKKLGEKWYCYNCNISRSILYGSVFYCAKISTAMLKLPEALNFDKILIKNEHLYLEDYYSLLKNWE